MRLLVNHQLISIAIQPSISFIIFLDFSMFYQIFLSPQVKRWVIITYKNGMYKLPHNLPNDLKLRILGNQEISGKCLNFIESQPSAQSPRQNKSFVNISRKLLKKEIKLFRLCPISDQNQSQSQIFCALLSLETFFDSNLLQTPSNLISLTVLVTLQSFTLF